MYYLRARMIYYIPLPPSRVVAFSGHPHACVERRAGFFTSCSRTISIHSPYLLRQDRLLPEWSCVCCSCASLPICLTCSSLSPSVSLSASLSLLVPRTFFIPNSQLSKTSGRSTLTSRKRLTTRLPTTNGAQTSSRLSIAFQREINKRRLFSFGREVGILTAEVFLNMHWARKRELSLRPCGSVVHRSIVLRVT